MKAGLPLQGPRQGFRSTRAGVGSAGVEMASGWDDGALAESHSATHRRAGTGCTRPRVGPARGLSVLCRPGSPLTRAGSRVLTTHLLPVFLTRQPPHPGRTSLKPHHASLASGAPSRARVQAGKGWPSSPCTRGRASTPHTWTPTSLSLCRRRDRLPVPRPQAPSAPPIFWRRPDGTHFGFVAAADRSSHRQHVRRRTRLE